MKLNELLDRVKTANGLKSDGELARKLDVDKRRVSDYRKGDRFPDEYACLKIAEALRQPLDTIIAQVKAATEKDEKRREAWENYMKRLGGIAASFITALIVTISCAVTTIVTTSPAEARGHEGISGNSLYYVKLCDEKKKRISSDPHPWAAAN